MMSKKMCVALLPFVLLIVGCTAAQKGAAIGGVSGAGLGAIIGHQSGHTKEGALIGGVAGALGGALIGDAIDKRQPQTPTQTTTTTPVPQAAPVTPQIESQQITATKVKGLVCPVCNRVYSSGQYCPYDGAKLQVKE
jgi:uncharacterized protein YcfJ